MENSIDLHVQHIRGKVNKGTVAEESLKTIFRYPPVVDSFLNPSETKVRTCLKGDWRFRPIEEVVKGIGDDYIAREFMGICSDLDKTKDLRDCIVELQTPPAISKKTLLQTYLMGALKDFFVNSRQWHHNKKLTTHIILTKLHPYCGVSGVILSNVESLLQTISNECGDSDIPKIERAWENGEKGKLLMNIGGKKLPIIENGYFSHENISQIQKKYSEKTCHWHVVISIKNETLQIKISLPVGCGYLEIQHSKKNNSASKDILEELPIYMAKVNADGSFEEEVLEITSPERHSGKVKIEVAIRKTAEASEKIEHDFYVDCLTLPHISRLSKEVAKDSVLLVPGPVPFHTISQWGGEIVLSKGYDSLLMPFREIVFFAYPGVNIRRVLRQASMYDDLLSKEGSMISQADLSFSLEHMQSSILPQLVNFPHTSSPSGKRSPDPQDTPIDQVARQQTIDDPSIDENEREELKTVEMYCKGVLSRKGGHSIYIGTESNPRAETVGRVTFLISFQGESEEISFALGTLIRRRVADRYELAPVEDVVEGDEIIYIQSDDRQTVDNYLIQQSQEYTDISLERILSPFTKLKAFYRAIKSVEGAKGYSQSDMDDINWLNESQRVNLFGILSNSLNKDYESYSKVYEELNNNIWYDLIKKNDLFSILSKNRRIGYGKIAKVAKELGLELAITTFNAYCSKALCETGDHYYFDKDDDLMAFGVLMGDQEIINACKEINDMGRATAHLRQIIGHAIARVTAGKADPLNELDSLIDENLMKGKVLQVEVSTTR